MATVIKVKLVCDRCAAVINDGISANDLRVEAQGRYHRREGRDLCLGCAALPPNGLISAGGSSGKDDLPPKTAQ